jgi:hypothetical protein
MSAREDEIQNLYINARRNETIRDDSRILMTTSLNIKIEW